MMRFLAWCVLLAWLCSCAALFGCTLYLLLPPLYVPAHVARGIAAGALAFFDVAALITFGYDVWCRIVLGYWKGY